MDPSRSRSCATTLVLVRGDTQTNRGRSFLPMLAQETAALRDLGLANVRFGAKSSRSVTTEPCPLYRPKADKRERSPNVRFVPIAAVSNRSKKKLLDHLVGGDKQPRRHGQAERTLGDWSSN